MAIFISMPHADRANEAHLHEQNTHVEHMRTLFSVILECATASMSVMADCTELFTPSVLSVRF